MTTRLLATSILVVSVAATGCAGPKPRVDYAGKAVPINVAFGKPTGDKAPSPPPGAVLGPAPSGVGVVPLVPGVSVGPGPGVTASPLPSTAPVLDTCPAQDPFSFPRREATNVVTEQVPEGQFPYRVSGSYTVNGKKSPYAQVVFETVKRLPPDAAGRQQFTVHYGLLGVPYTLTYVVTPPPDPNVSGEIGLASIVQDNDNGASFRPAKPLRLLQLRAEKGVSWADATTDPLSASSATVDGTIVEKARLNACGKPVEAWKSQVTQRIITPGQDITATRTLYFGTGYGGLLMGEQVSYSGTAGGDTVSGASTTTINVDPGDGVVRAAVAVLLGTLLLSACGGGDKSAFIPPGTYAGSTASDQAFTLDVGEDVTLNKHKGRLVKRGVVEVKNHGITTTLRCKVTDDKGEELRCDVSTAPPGGASPTTEVIDLMLL